MREYFLLGSNALAGGIECLCISFIRACVYILPHSYVDLSGVYAGMRVRGSISGVYRKNCNLVIVYFCKPRRCKYYNLRLFTIYIKMYGVLLAFQSVKIAAVKSEIYLYSITSDAFS